MLKAFRTSLLMAAMTSLLFGVLYPSLVWIGGRLFFPRQAEGSLIFERGRIVGSEWIGQSFTSPRYFSSRPSETAGKPYNFMASGASNLDPTHPELLKRVKERADILRKSSEANLVPLDLVTASGSGLDPHISPEAALFQIERVASARGLSIDKIARLVEEHIEEPTFGFLGEARVNVLRLNLSLDRMEGGGK